METSRIETLPPPPNVIGALKEGFDTISNHMTAILLPLVLDLFLWLGPHLGISSLLQSWLPNIQKIWKAFGYTAAQIQEMMKNFDKLQETNVSLNLLSALRTFPIGISSLISGTHPVASPLGHPLIYQVNSPEGIVGWVVLLTLLGWLGGGIYFRWVASLVLPKEQSVPIGAIWQSISLSVMFMMLSFIVGMPLLLVIYILFSLSPALGQIVLLVMGFLSMWLVVPLFFAGHGIFMRSQNVFASILSGMKMARFTLPSSSLFVLSVLSISIGLNYLWSIPKPDSWMLLVGILGHAFITTALLAASFIFYRDMTTWLQTVLEKLKIIPATPKA